MTVQNDAANGYLICTDQKDHTYYTSTASVTANLDIGKRKVKIDGYIAKYTGTSGEMCIGINHPIFYTVDPVYYKPVDDEYGVAINHQGQSFTIETPQLYKYSDGKIWISYLNPIRQKKSGNNFSQENYTMGTANKGTEIHITRIYYAD